MKKFLSVVMALAMTLTLVTVGASASDFTDKSTISYDEAVDVISSLKVVDGYTDGSFNPTATLTRGAAAKIICNLLLGPTTASALGVTAAPFSDVPVSNVFAGYIAYCSSQGIINGYADGTFKPTATVTGFQFMKMLLGALGYDGSIEGFTGTNWTVNVAKLAISIGLDDGNDSFVGSKAMTREEAALYAFNTLKANVVEYSNKGTTVTVNGATIVTGATKATAVTLTETASTDYARTSGASSIGYQQFCEKYFSKLIMNSGVVADAFGRPAHAWKNGTTSIGTYADDAVISYNGAVKASQVAADLGSYYLASDVPANYKVNNTDTIAHADAFTTAANVLEQNNSGNTLTVDTETVAKAIADETANGKVVEIYVDDDTNVITKIVEVTYTVAKVSSVTTTSSKTTYTFDTGASGINYVDPDLSDTISISGTIAKGDIVTLVQPASGKLYVYPTTSISGTQSSKTSDNTITVSGTTYDVAVGVTGTAMTNFANSTKTATYYIDQFGYVVKTTGSAASTDYAYIIGTYGKLTTSVDGTVPTAQVKVVLADGTIATYDLKLDKLASGDSMVGATVNVCADDTNITTTTAAVGDYIIDGTNICVYDKSGTNTSAGVALLVASLDKVVGYTVSSSTLAVEPLTAIDPDATMTVDDVYYTGAVSGLYDNLTSATIAGSSSTYDKTMVISSTTLYVVYNSDKGTTAVYTGNTGLPSTVDSGSSITGYAAMSASTTGKASASVIFATISSAFSSEATDNYVYIDASDYGTGLNSSGSNVYTYTGYKADGTTIALTKSSQLNTSTGSGLYKYNTDSTVGTALASTSTTTLSDYYLYDAALTLSDGMLGAGGAFYNVTDDTQIVYIDSDLGAVDGNGGYVVLAANSDNTASANVATIYVTVD